MRISLILCLAAAMLGRAAAQTDLLATLPNCTVQCFQTSISNTSCSPSDIPCLCGDQAFLGAIQGCQAQSCTIKEVLTSTNATLAACGVPPGDQSATIVGIPASFGSLAILLVLIRIFGRLWITKVDLDWDDYLIVLAVISASVLNFVCYPMAHLGMGKDFWTIPFPDIDMTLKLLYVAEIFYMFAEMLVQMSLLAFYIRVFPEASLFVRRSSWTLIAIVACFGIANTCTMIFQCIPIPFFWSGWAGEMTGKCIDINLFSWIRAAIEIAIDVAILSLPLPSVFKLQMSWKKKAQVLLMLALGFVITVVSILRLQSLIQFAKTSNPTYDNSPAIYWSVLECDMFIICACLPALRSVLSKLAPRFFGTTRKNSYPSGDYYRHEGSNQDSERQVSSHHLRSLDSSGKITKSVDVDVTQEQRTASDEDLVYPPRSYYLSDS
ncbi:hypothetical protein B0J15DRAFT_526719 [Fusarium solani]|uniref:CFEM domain-containing protein n=2 Tax=Fusarium solani TaxID=169388 RepID=A0A9P9H975_FUSSL|nr:uncharacterized protein B0J15DRAFT_526719 [Fusarium solani]KAH7253444.1 hypothetical protein B0J15DRAFT_526719 [Fusarium solani]